MSERNITDKGAKFAFATPQQKMVYFEWCLDTKGISYNIPVLLKLEKNVDFEKLEHAVNIVVESNDILRTNFDVIDGEIVQVINDNRKIVFTHINIDEVDDEIALSYVKPFNLKDDILLSITAFHCVTYSALLINVHHIILDGMSIPLFFNKVIDVYLGKDMVDNEQYAGFAQMIGTEKYLERINIQKQFWQSKLSGDFSSIDIPCDFTRGKKKDFKGDHIRIDIGQELSELVIKYCKTNRLSINGFWLSVLELLVYKYSGQERFIIGSVVHGRTTGNYKRCLGMFNNYIPLIFKVNSSLDIANFMQENEREIKEEYRNSDYPYIDMIKDMGLSRDDSRNPLFDVMLIYHGNLSKIYKKDAEFKIVEHRRLETPNSKLDLKFDISQDKNKSFSIVLEYSTSLFKESTVKCFLKMFCRIAQIIAGRECKKISDVQLYSNAELKTIFGKMEGIRPDYPNCNIFTLFENAVRESSEKIAIKYNNKKISYKDLYERSIYYSLILNKHGVSKQDIVIIRINDISEVVAAMLGILRIGAIYIPIDPYYPSKRVSEIIVNSGAKYIITDEAYSGLSCCVINITETIDINDNKELKESVITIDDIAYVLYTSGTTGKPKGVRVKQSNIINLIFNSKYIYCFDKSDVWTLFHAYTFDFSVWEIYGCLLNQGTLVIVPKELRRDPKNLLSLIKNEQVTVLNQTPSAFENLIFEEKKHNEQVLESLKYVIFGGEKLRPSILKAISFKYPHIEFVNMYGITETTVHVTYSRINKDMILADKSNIGKAIPNVYVLLLDKDMKAVPIGGKGEIYVGGDGVADGYMNNNKLTNERFVVNPYKKGQIIYKSGDEGVLLDDYSIEYIGRNDRQVQLHGHRIELKEIEDALLSLDSIDDCCVILANNNDNEFLCAYCVSESELYVNELREHLSELLPQYMIPSSYVKLDEFPLNSNSKIDKKSLPSPVSNILMSPESMLSNRAMDKCEEKLKKIWGNILSKFDICPADDFFMVGGDSMEAFKLVAYLNDIGVDISVADIYSNSTLEAMARNIKKICPEFDQIVLNDKKDTYKECIACNKNINSLFENYNWLELDCFHRPVGMVFDSFHHGWGRIVLLYAAYAYTHFIFEYKNVLNGEHFEIYECFLELYAKELVQKMGIEVSKEKADNERAYYDALDSALLHHNIVIVPIDLFEVFYTRHYKEEHHIHYLIVKGVDTKKNLYFIQDCEHINYGDNNSYKSFVVTKELLYKAHLMYNKFYKNLDNAFFWCFKEKVKKNYTTIMALKDFSSFLKRLQEDENEIIYIEEMLVELHKLNKLPDINRSIIYILNLKKVILDLINDLYQEVSGDVTELLKATQEMEQLWNNYRAMFYNHYDNHNVNYNNSDLELINNCLQCEKKIENTIIVLNSCIKNDNIKHKPQKIKSEIVFEHEFEKTYVINNIKDESLKFEYPVDNRNFILEGELNCVSERGLRFIFGIIIRFESGKDILFGNYRNRKVAIVDLSESVNFPCYEKSMYLRPIHIKVMRQGDTLFFYCKYQEENSYELIYEMSLQNRIVSTGFFSMKQDFFEHKCEVKDIRFSFV